MAVKLPTNLRHTSAFRKMKLSLSSIKVKKDGTVMRTRGGTQKRAAIQRASQVLVENGMMPAAPTPNNMDTERYAQEMLTAMGYTVEIQQEGYTLVDSQLDFEPLPGFPKQIPEVFLNNQAIEMVKSFPNPCDPIYTPDENMPTSLQGNLSYISPEVAASLDLVNTANVFSSMGLDKTPSRLTSRYFENSSVNSALKVTK